MVTLWDPSLIPYIAAIPALLDDSESAAILLERVCQLNTCSGNPESRFVALGEAKKNRQFLSLTKDVVAYLDTGICVSANGHNYPSTVRCSKCRLLTQEEMNLMYLSLAYT